jgi:hypothetical protein
MAAPGRLLRAAFATLAALASSNASVGSAQSAEPAQSAPPARSAAPAPSGAPPALEPGSGDAATETTGFALGPYQERLAEKRLDAAGPLGTAQLSQLIQTAEAQLSLGRRDEAIAVLAGVVESARFAPLAALDEGRAATFLLADALGRAGIYGMARGYLTRLLQTPERDGWYRRSIGRLVDLGLESGDPAPFVAVLAHLPPSPRAPWAGDIAYLTGILHERAGDAPRALAAYAAVTNDNRFWAQATYRAGLIEVEQGRLGDGEKLFCRIADPKQTPRLAPLFGGNEFFQVRDLSRLALGRVAHEAYRFDDARYYYHLVPGDSDRLPEALYESATSRYEAKDYSGAHALLGELQALGRHHVYEDEALILDAYVDLARCEFPRADAKLAEFLKRYEPVLTAARQLQHDPSALRSLLDGHEDAIASALGLSRDVSEMIRTSVRIDASYGGVSRQLADLDRALGGLGAAPAQIEQLQAAVAGGVVAARPVSAAADGATDRLARFDEQTAAVRRLLRESGQRQGAAQAELAAIKQELNAVEAEAESWRARSSTAEASPRAEGQGMSELLARDAALVGEAAQAVRAALDARQHELALEAVRRLEQRLSRLVRRARAGRIETVLGRKRALELEVEALSQGFLPQGAVDSLDAARYLSDDEEYWPFDGEDWEDEYIGGEGLR